MAKADVTKLVKSFFDKKIIYYSEPRNFGKVLDPKNFKASSSISIKDVLRPAQKKPLKLSPGLVKQAKTRALINSRKKGIQ